MVSLLVSWATQEVSQAGGDAIQHITGRLAALYGVEFLPNGGHYFLLHTSPLPVEFLPACPTDALTIPLDQQHMPVKKTPGTVLPVIGSDRVAIGAVKTYGLGHAVVSFSDGAMAVVFAASSYCMRNAPTDCSRPS